MESNIFVKFAHCYSPNKSKVYSCISISEIDTTVGYMHAYKNSTLRTAVDCAATDLF